jgi:serine/threonine protein kinase/HAMP domain-containing protein
MIQVVGRYQIQQELGQGGMALVYKAYDPNIDRTLAIKILREERCVDNEYRNRFLREAKAAGNLSHANIVTIYDVGEYANRPYIVMELLQGTPLDEIMKAGRTFSMEDVIQIGIQLASALDYAHRNGVVHRDIKPSNIVCSMVGDKVQNIKITDFGIAHVEDTSLTHQTQMGEVLGTPQYMSPEQVLGQKVDGRSDLFSVGVILYQLLTGQKPFKGDTVATLLFQIATEDPTPVEKLTPDIPVALRQVVDKLLKKQADKRYQTGAELADALKRVLRHVQEKAHGRGEQRIIPIRVKWTVIMALVVAITMIASVAVIYQKQYGAMTNQSVDFGGSLVRFIATESAVPILSEDWVSIELFVQEITERQEFSYVTILDHRGVIRGDSNPKKIGSKYKGFSGEAEISNEKRTKVVSRVLPDGAKAFDFDTPILFQNKEIGRVHLGLSQKSMQKVANVTLITLVILMAITITAVVVIAYILGLYISWPIKLLRRSLEEITAGDFHYRIAQKRNDEFGQLFQTFDQMAESLQKRHED